MRLFRPKWILAAAAATAAAAGALTIASDGTAVAQGNGGHEIVVTIKRIRALDKIDMFSKADFYARITIAGTAVDTPVIKQKADIEPNWVVSQRVRPGTHDVRIEVFDKDLKKSELIDVNRIDGRRFLDFQVNTRSCRILGFAGGYRCGADIQRAGEEKKKAELTFTVDVKR